ncbi:MAG: hypothetical protein JXR63_02435, partial [Spirochaetales bacterium]|nr:hypothetical protein [Spirochaetales bacterium]
MIKSSFLNFDKFQWIYRIRFSVSHTGKGSKITMVCDLGRFKFAIFSMILVSIFFSILAGVLAETFLATLFIIGGSSLMVLIF